VLELASVADIVWEPAEEPGITNVQLKAPEERLVTVDGDVAWLVPSYLTVMVLEPA